MTFKSGRGGARYDKQGNLLTGRHKLPLKLKRVRITPSILPKYKALLNSRPGSQGQHIEAALAVYFEEESK